MTDKPADPPSEGDRAKPTRPEGKTALIGDGPPDPVLVHRFRLVVDEGPDAGATYESTRDKAILGTHASSDLLLTDRTVSRFHCELRVDHQRGVIVRDLGSRNETLVDGVPVIEAKLRPSAVLTLGYTRVRFDLGHDRVTLPVSEADHFGLLVGTSRPMRVIYALLERAASSDATVLLTGETGTGKSVTAESIHVESARRDGPFVVVDCGALPASLLDSELFGHEKGAFTGADRARPGAFEEAHKGTLFLDEIGELSPDLQPKLLRVLETKQVKRLGSNRYLPADVRLIAATNRKLREEVNAGRFRSDLYYRLAVLEATLPALRERSEDLAALVEGFYRDRNVIDVAERAGLRSKDFHTELARHSWPGNVRELRNYLERCLAMQTAVPLAREEGTRDAPPVDPSLPLSAARERWTAWCERKYVTAVLEHAGGNVSAAAREAGVARAHLYRLLWQYGLR